MKDRFHVQIGELDWVFRSVGESACSLVSGATTERKGLEEALSYVREGDTLVVWRLDRLGRSLQHLIETITKLNNRKIGFKSITGTVVPPGIGQYKQTAEYI